MNTSHNNFGIRIVQTYITITIATIQFILRSNITRKFRMLNQETIKIPEYSQRNMIAARWTIRKKNIVAWRNFKKRLQKSLNKYCTANYLSQSGNQQIWQKNICYAPCRHSTHEKVGIENYKYTRFWNTIHHMW